MELKTLIKFFEEEYLFMDEESVIIDDLCLNQKNEALSKFINLMPVVSNRHEYFDSQLPFLPKIPDFESINSKEESLKKWNNFIFLLRRTIEKRDLSKPIFRFTEPKGGALPMRAFYPKNPLDIDDSLGFVRPY